MGVSLSLRRIAVSALLVPSAFSMPGNAQRTGQKTFSSAEEACKALIAALESHQQADLLAVLGADARDVISSGDSSEDQNERQQFVSEYKQMHRLVLEPDGKTTLYVGAGNWPAPIPLDHKGSVWFFDTAAGKQEIAYRRIGANELAVVHICDELVDAEKEYQAKPHDGETIRQYARRISSTPGKHDGLYWQTTGHQDESPVGRAMAAADADAENLHGQRKVQPFYGYYFRVLTGDKKARQSSATSYLVDGKMTRGFAFVAYPAKYRDTGVMTFLVDEDGLVYEKDLGPRTAEIARTMRDYEVDATWRKSQ